MYSSFVGKVLTKGDNNGKGDNPMDISELIFIKKTDENGHSVVVGETVTTLKDPHGNIRKIATIETVDSDEGKFFELYPLLAEVH